MGGAFALFPVPAGNRHLAADNGLYPGLPGGQGKFHGAEEIAAVGDGHRRHGIVASQRRQIRNSDGPFEQRIGGMNAKMNEVGMRHREALLGKGL